MVSTTWIRNNEILSCNSIYSRMCFYTIGNAVSDACRAGDIDTASAETMKIFGNSSYGKTITNKEEKMKATTYANYDNISDKLIIHILHI